MLVASQDSAPKVTSFILSMLRGLVRCYIIERFDVVLEFFG